MKGLEYLIGNFHRIWNIRVLIDETKGALIVCIYIMRNYIKILSLFYLKYDNKKKQIISRFGMTMKIKIFCALSNELRYYLDHAGAQSNPQLKYHIFDILLRWKLHEKTCHVLPIMKHDKLILAFL